MTCTKAATLRWPKRPRRQRPARPPPIRCRALCENYLKREGASFAPSKTVKRDLERLVYPVIGHEPVAALRRGQVVRMLDGIEDKCGARTADLQLAYLSRVFNWHASRSDEFRSPLVRGMSRSIPKTGPGRGR